jgi:hypothetical protein
MHLVAKKSTNDRENLAIDISQIVNGGSDSIDEANTEDQIEGWAKTVK